MLIVVVSNLLDVTMYPTSIASVIPIADEYESAEAMSITT